MQLNFSPRQSLVQLLNVLMVVSSAFMCYKGVGVLANSESPVVVVLSGSMEPAFQRGDILFLWNREHRVKVGDVVVYNVDGKSIPIVHRVMREHSSDKKQLLLTKGDNNAADDLNLYAKKQMYLDREADIVGVVKGYVPKVGYATILMTENQNVKYIVLGVMLLTSFLQRE